MRSLIPCLLTLLLGSLVVQAQQNQWTWMSGNSYTYEVTVYSDTNTIGPGSREGSATWTDTNGFIWLFGGQGYTRSNMGLLDDLWRYDVANNQWKWIKGSNTINQPGRYGFQSVPSAENNPGARFNAANWIDSDGNLWLFGGYGKDSSSITGRLNDLWKYNPNTNEWTWLNGQQSIDGIGNYGTLGQATQTNLPGARSNPGKWIDSLGQLWLFGGIGYGSNTSYGWLNDVWRYNPDSNLWTWINGSNLVDQYGEYDTIGAYTTNNQPGARFRSQNWVDSTDCFWVFSGYGYSTNSFGNLSDLWKFDPSTNMWMWVQGDSTLNKNGVYGSLNIADSNNFPGSRNGGTAWIGKDGLWLMGGTGYDASNTSTGKLNDLWKFMPDSGMWVWVNGSQTINQYGNYGTQGIASATNQPGGRHRSNGWTDINGDLWLFAGDAYGTNSSGNINDLWKYDVDSNLWTWIYGLDTVNALTVYTDTIRPGARLGSGTWTDTSGNLWMFGGLGYAKIASLGRLNDLWKYSPENGTWDWVSGGTKINQFGVYGTQGVSSPTNQPGTRHSTNTWTDSIGNLWMLGGWGYGSTISQHYLDDLWKFDPVSSEWTWVKGNVNGQNGVYGTKGSSASTNNPGGRQDACTWIDSNGVMWLFGGKGKSSSTTGRLNDLWKYDPSNNQWTWVNGDNIADQKGIYGTQGIANSTNKPGARQYAKGWIDQDGLLWMFGGQGYDSTSLGMLNDLWMYNPQSNKWTWINGSRFIYDTPTYGELGVATNQTSPSSKFWSLSWTDTVGNFWLFGGFGLNSTLNSGKYNDLWKYVPATNQWTWMKGDSIFEQLGIYGEQGVADSANTPGARYYSSSWEGKDGGLWLYGGNGNGKYGSAPFLNDLWRYEPDYCTDYTTIYIEKCDSFHWNITGEQYYESGKFVATTQNAEGCDSILILDLTINYSNESYTSNTVCDSYFWPVDSNSYDSSGVYSAVLVNQFGCDSTIWLDLEINYSSYSFSEAISCDSFTWSANNMTYTNSGVYQHVLSNIAGCDSIMSLDLTIAEPIMSKKIIEKCESYTLPNGQIITSDSIYYDTISNAGGCDSIVKYIIDIGSINDSVISTIINDTLTLIAVDSESVYQWFNCQTNQPVLGATQQHFTASFSGSFAVILYNYTCSDTSECTSVAVGTDELSKTENLVIYPNPTRRISTIQSDQIIESIRVQNIVGELVCEPIKGNSDKWIDVDLSGLPSGVYLINVQTVLHTETLTIIKN